MLEIIQISSLPQLSYEGDSLISLYQEVFAEPPEYQIWSRSELESIFADYCDRGYLFVAVDGSIPVGFCAIIPFISSSIWCSTASDGFNSIVIDSQQLYSQLEIDAQRAWYIADLGVSSKYRRQSLATELLKVACSGRHPVIIRVSLCRKSAIALYKKLGFQPLNLFQNASYKQTNGEVKAFEKMLMILK
ncbi:MAG TPA: GNAT family N-acetyltransferase [Oculatellaceae cyanobacterium]|jgi:ribosomal protein S18 acetylase RimI-like enzyme